MTRTRDRTPSRHRASRAFSLAETAMCVLLVGGVLVVALNTVGDAVVGRQKMGDQGRGQLLARDLMTEILSQEYEDPDDSPLFGLEGTENGATRADFDDVDDYHNWDSQPPQDSAGVQMLDLGDWRRRVTVEWVEPNDLTAVSVTSTDVKRITIEIERGGVALTDLVAIRSLGLPPPKPGPTVLFVVTNVGNPTAQEDVRQTLMDAWGCAVELIAVSASQSEFDAAAASADVAYVPEQISDLSLGAKLTGVSIGVVNEHAGLVDEFGFSSDVHLRDRDQLEIVDGAHYITGPPLTLGWVTLFSSVQPVHMLVEPAAPGLQVLAETNNMNEFTKPSLAVLETGAELDSGGFAAGRRVQLPWGAPGFDINALNADGQTLMKRAIEWAANQEQP